MSSGGRTFGHISGVEVGAVFKDKHELRRVGVHVQHRGGIHGNQELGAFSICLSKGHYSDDDVDNGNIIKFVGSGGSQDGVQMKDQSFDHQYNHALFVSSQTKRPVRVVRGANKDNLNAPVNGYCYDGLYVVDEANIEKGKQGFNMCTFKLRRIEEEGQGPITTKRTLTTKKLAKMRQQSRSM